MKLAPESRVVLRADYNGYFRDLKGKPLTVMQVFPADKRTLDGPKITVAEIEEIHLLNVSSVEEYHENTGKTT